MHTYHTILDGTERLDKGLYTVYFGIIDPLSGEPGITFAMKEAEKLYPLGNIQIR